MTYRPPAMTYRPPALSTDEAMEAVRERLTRPRNLDAPATDKAIAFMLGLGGARDNGMEIEDFLEMVQAWRDGDVLTAGFVSDRIDEYRTLPFRPTSATKVEPGYYTLGAGYIKEFYVVVETKDKQRTYAKQLVKTETLYGTIVWDWEYVRGAVSKLRGLTPLTLEEAAEWGRLHGQCIICQRALSDPESVQRGIGPVCQKKVAKT
jgi:Family of unknown function (DUF6011)